MILTGWLWPKPHVKRGDFFFFFSFPFSSIISAFFRQVHMLAHERSFNWTTYTNTQIFRMYTQVAILGCLIRSFCLWRAFYGFCFCWRESGVHFAFFSFENLSAGYYICESTGYMVLYATLLNILYSDPSHARFPLSYTHRSRRGEKIDLLWKSSFFSHLETSLIQ